MTSYLKTMLAGLRQWITAQKADWNQNDETAANYIKGRPCYETDPQEVYLAKDETVTLEKEGNEPDDWAVAELASPIVLEDGKTYTVTWDGEKYSVVGSAYDGVVVIGNMLIVGLGDTEEPFVIASIGANGIIVFGLGAGEHTFSVSMTERKIIPLPRKFLPDIPAEKLPDIPAEKLPTIPAEKLPTIPTDKLPTIPAEKLPTIPTDKLPTIPAEKLPDNNVFVEQKTFDGTYDKAIEGRDTFNYNAFNYYKISEFAPSRENVISFSGTRADGNAASIIQEGKNCCKYGLFIVVYQAGRCNLSVTSTISLSFDAPSAGLYARYEPGNDSMTAGTYNFTCKIIRFVVQDSNTMKRYYLDVDDTGTLTATEITG